MSELPEDGTIPEVTAFRYAAPFSLVVNNIQDEAQMNAILDAIRRVRGSTEARERLIADLLIDRLAGASLELDGIVDWSDETAAAIVAALVGRPRTPMSEHPREAERKRLFGGSITPPDQEDTERKEWRCAPGEHSWQRFPQISDGIVCAKCGADQEDTDA